MLRNHNKYKRPLRKHSSAKDNSGFSMIELVVILGILAILAAVLIPSLLIYTERTRTQKDLSATDELVNSILISMADQDIYDEVVEKSVENNVSCYIDSSTESLYNKIITKIGSADAFDEYTFSDDARLADETPYYAAGNMRGVTITFEPTMNVNSKSTYYELAHAIINKFVNASEGMILNEDCNNLYHSVRQTVGERMPVQSQTYRNSEFTVFIRIGTTGGNEVDKQGVLSVYGQFSGTNLPRIDQLYYIAQDREGEVNDNSGDTGDAGAGSGTATIDPDLLDGDGIFITTDKGVPAGGHYYVGITTRTLGDYSSAKHTYAIGDDLPSISTGDVFVYGDYEYRYNCFYNGSRWEINDSQGGWGVRVLSKSKMTYKSIITVINGAVVNTMRCTFYQCSALLNAPTIPKPVTNMRSTFNGCTALVKAPNLPNGLTNMTATFRHCASLLKAPNIPRGVTIMNLAFENCTALSGGVQIDAMLRADSNINKCFGGTSKLIYLHGSSTMLRALAATDGYDDLSEKDNVRVAAYNPGNLDNDVVPEGGVYYVGVGESAHGNYSSAIEILEAGDQFPSITQPGDVYVYDDYEYRYGCTWVSSGNTWVFNSSESWSARVIATNKTEYGPILISINTKPVANLTRTFMNCSTMVVSPSIPNVVTNLDGTYYGCTKLETAGPIQKNIKTMNQLFCNCKSLAGVIEINSKSKDYTNCFRGTSQRIYLTGSSSKLSSIAGTDGYADKSDKDNVRVLASDQVVANYIVNHWQQNIEGDATKHDDQNYTIKETQKLKGIVGSTISPNVRTYTGFSSPTAQTVTINSDGKVVVDYYYTRNSYYIDINLQWDGVFYTTISKSQSPVLFTITVNDKIVAKDVADFWKQYPYGSTYSIAVCVKSGYYWDGSTHKGTLSGVVRGTVSVAPIVKTNKSTTYIVNHWLQNLDGDVETYDDKNYTKCDTSTIVALVGQEVCPYTNSYTGFASPSRQGAIVKDNGVTVINYYYERHKYYLDLNTMIDGVSCNNSTTNTACWFRVTINGKEVADKVGDYYTQWPYGTEYSVVIIPRNGYQWDGTLSRTSAQLSGTITGTTAVCPVFESE